jgi:hypothetical protein
MPNYNNLTTAQLIHAAADRVGRDAEQLALRELTKAEATIGRWRTRDAAFSYPPSPEGRLGGGGSEWRGETLRSNNTPDPYRGRGLPPPGTLQNPFPPLGPDQQVEASQPFRYGQGGERERDVRAAQRDQPRGPSFASGLQSTSPPRDESGYIQPIRPGDPRDPGRQGLGYNEREDGDITEDDLDLVDQHGPADPEDEPVGLLEHHHQGSPQDYFLAHDASTGNIGVFRHGSDKPAAWVRPAPGMGVRDYVLSRDRRSGRIAIMRRRNRDRMRRLQHAQDRLGRGRVHDSAQRERQLLAMQNQINAEFWRKPQSKSDFWGRR